MTFSELLAAAEAGAASVYHAVLATAEEVESWETSPVVAPLVTAGVTAANSLLDRTGANGSVITSDVTTALKLLAAKDATVPSIGSIGALAGLVGTVASVVDPAAAPAVAAAEAVARVAETAVTDIATPAPTAP